MQTYYDYATPALAAGAIQMRNTRWRLPDGGTAYSAADVLHELDLKPVKVEPPKGRTFKAIQKTVRNVSADRGIGGRDHYAMRAVQYMLKMRGVDTTHRQDPYGCTKRVRWDKAEDGSNRVRFVEIEGEWLEVPHWDFVPKMEQLS
ncbi:hypothetical protein [Shinella zoogloeoides]|uniref:hypothetical protein n=1 Tax=Shinella zoogloeoides TaxID=352475 RepID=UPI0028AB25DE|nr:hypothetical protein [Shinella zoogloeoides]